MSHLRLIEGSRPPKHALGFCDLKPGNDWRECDCAEIDPADRPCITCEALAESAKTCPACAAVAAERAAKP